MIDQLVQVCCPSGSSPELIDPVECSNWEVLKLRTEVQRLQRENLELRQQVGYWQSRHRDSLKRIAALEQEIEQLKGEKRQLQADLFGRRSETKPLNDRSNHLDDPQDDSQQPKRKRGQQPENHGPKRRDYSGLPVRETFGSSVFKCKTSRIGPSGPWPSGGCARSSSRSLATPDSSPGSIGPTDSSLTSVHRYAW